MRSRGQDQILVWIVKGDVKRFDRIVEFERGEQREEWTMIADLLTCEDLGVFGAKASGSVGLRHREVDVRLRCAIDKENTSSCGCESSFRADICMSKEGK
jgi:hypothetical protein